MVRDQSMQTDLELDFAATVTLTALPRFLCMDLLVTVCRLLDGTGVTAVLEPDLTTMDEAAGDSRVWNRPKVPPRLGLTFNGVTLLIVGRDRPAFTPTEAAQLDYRGWPNGGSRMARARAHIEITEVKAAGGSSLDHNYDRAAAMTVVAAAVTKLTDALAVVWHRSRCAVSADRLVPLVEKLAQGQAPVALWFGCAEEPDGSRSAKTRGLYPLLGAEIEVVPFNLSGEIAVELALESAAEVLKAGEPPAHGAMIPYDKNTEFRVLHRASKKDGTAPAIVLTQVAHRAEPTATAGAA